MRRNALANGERTSGEVLRGFVSALTRREFFRRASEARETPKEAN
jgi:hypothetical protein